MTRTREFPRREAMERKHVGYCFDRALGELVQCPHISGNGGGCMNQLRRGKDRDPCYRISNDALDTYMSEVYGPAAGEVVTEDSPDA
jgi:hypothetical protein